MQAYKLKASMDCNSELHKDILPKLIVQINQSGDRQWNVLEVCGTHTRAIYQYGIRELVKPKLNLLSGPGCPICVTSEAYIEAAILLLQQPNRIVVTFGDMMRVKGSHHDLLQQKGLGKDIRIVYSPLEAVTLAEQLPDKEIIFLAVGFETTAPIIALAVLRSQEKRLRNLSFLIGLKRMEPILHHVLSDPEHKIDGILCPGHVAAVMGADYFRFVTEQYHLPAVITGFTARDIIGALYSITLQKEAGKAEFQNLYPSCVSPGGNRKAIMLMEDMFCYCDARWRGIGHIKGSGLAIQNEFSCYDAAVKFGLDLQQENKKEIQCEGGTIILQQESKKEFQYDSSAIVLQRENKKENQCEGSTIVLQQESKKENQCEGGSIVLQQESKKELQCECSAILLGKKQPGECNMYGGNCTPDHPMGPCMISSEGACSVAYQYR